MINTIMNTLEQKNKTELEGCPTLGILFLVHILWWESRGLGYPLIPLPRGSVAAVPVVRATVHGPSQGANQKADDYDDENETPHPSQPDVVV